MAEAFAIAAGVIAVIQISDRIAIVCEHYIESVHGTPSELRRVLIEISSLGTIFENLEFLRTCHGRVSAIVSSLLSKDGPVEECHRSIKELESLFPSKSIHEASKGRSKKRKLQATLSALAWPLNQNKAKRLLADIARHRETILLTLTSESMQDIKEIKAKTSEIRDILTENERFEFFKWLIQTDPSPLHHRNQKFYELGTAEWVLRFPEWTDWLDAKQRCLWIHGIPGAGKSVLMSHIIEQVKQYCEASTSKCVSVYYYCFYGHNQDEAAPFLRWLLAQLCRQADRIPLSIHNACKPLVMPSIKVLLEAVRDISGDFDRVYVLLDAIDESNPKEDLLGVLRTFITDPRFEKLQLLASSRRYEEIKRIMEKISMPISMSNEYIEEDIRRNVHSLLHTNSKFSQWPDDLLCEVENTVPKKAEGMFRLAVCQIDALKRLKCERAVVQKALETLPKTLDETYDRILAAVPEEEQPFVQHALQWVIFHNEHHAGWGIPAAIFYQGVEESTAFLNAELTGLMCSNEALEEACGCLIEITAQDEDQTLVNFAHYTVREYLDSSRISKSSTSYTTTCKQNLQPDLVRTIFAKARKPDRHILLEINEDNINSDDIWCMITESFSIHCLVFAFSYLRDPPSEIYHQDATFDLAIDILDASKPSFEDMMRFMRFCQRIGGIFSVPEGYEPMNRLFDIEWESLPQETAASQLLHLLYLSANPLQPRPSVPPLVAKFLGREDIKTILQTRIQFSSRETYHNPQEEDRHVKFDGTIIEIAAQLAHLHKEAFELLLDHSRAYNPSNILVQYVGSHQHKDDSKNCREEFCSLVQLLEQGADPSSPRSYVTPLQIAVARRDLQAVNTLLDAGANVNAVGDTASPCWGEKTWMERFNQFAGVHPLKILLHDDYIELFDIDQYKDIDEVNDARIENLLLMRGALEIIGQKVDSN